MNENGWKKGDLGAGYMLCYMATVDEYDVEYRNGNGHEFATQWHVCWFGIYEVLAVCTE